MCRAQLSAWDCAASASATNNCRLDVSVSSAASRPYNQADCRSWNQLACKAFGLGGGSEAGVDIAFQQWRDVLDDGARVLRLFNEIERARAHREHRLCDVPVGGQHDRRDL